ncbi:MAG: VWA domain-containing protein [Chitinophagaceae bacterium]|nr:VWA domain-containing protein [Chitinophagaceae bacterium]MBP8243079.1 VWA domain-containing protein [Chitinophagaceae bacterium]
MDLTFQYKNLRWPWLILLALLLLFGIYLIWKKRTLRKTGELRLLQLLTASYSPTRFYLKYFLLFLAITVGILAAMNPGKISGQEKQQRKGIDLTIALDVSKSMLAADISPSRLEKAKQFISKLIDVMPDDRIALVLFAGKAYMQMPLTTDHGAAKLFVSAAGPEAIPGQGTVISEAMDMASRAFSSGEKRFKSILLISDGEDHDPDAGKKAKELASQGVMLITIGVGSAEGSVIPDPLTGLDKKDASGNTIISKLNEDLLKELATTTNGLYLNLQGTEPAVNAVKSQLSQIEKKAFSDQSQLQFQGFFIWLAAAMLLLLLVEPFVKGKRRVLA